MGIRIKRDDVETFYSMIENIRYAIFEASPGQILNLYIVLSVVVVIAGILFASGINIVRLFIALFIFVAIAAGLELLAVKGIRIPIGGGLSSIMLGFFGMIIYLIYPQK